MLFSSPEYILLLLPVAFAGYFLLTRVRLVLAAKVWLVAVSLFFYGYWDPAYVPLLLGSILFNFAVGSALAPQAAGAQQGASPGLRRRLPRRGLLVLGIAANLGLLGYYKYTDFFIENLNTLFALEYGLPGIVLPIGISFFTFTQIAFLVDSYQGKAKEYDLTNYALFVSFFPQLIAGPILHHHEMMSQFESRWTWAIRYRHLFLGLFIFSIGLFKKVVIADTFAIWANAGFDQPQAVDFFSAWATSLSYTFQLYFDFSGYCDMAIGAGLLFNIWLPINFNSPYKALDIQDFWRRWHITLSRYLRDYLYIPLGGNRRGTSATYANLLATFVLGGLWHGASWMFVIWGALHGLALIVHRAWGRFGVPLPSALAWLLTFGFVNLTWVFFRAESMADALQILRGMFDLRSALALPVAAISTDQLAWGGWLMDVLLLWLPNGLVAHLLTFSAVAIAFVIIAEPNAQQLLFMRGHAWAKLFGGLLLFCVAMYVMMASSSAVFLYYNF